MKNAAQASRESQIQSLAYWRGRASLTDQEILGEICEQRRQIARVNVKAIEDGLAEDARIAKIVHETGTDEG